MWNSDKVVQHISHAEKRISMAHNLCGISMRYSLRRICKSHKILQSQNEAHNLLTHLPAWMVGKELVYSCIDLQYGESSILCMFKISDLVSYRVLFYWTNGTFKTRSEKVTRDAKSRSLQKEILSWNAILSFINTIMIKQGFSWIFTRRIWISQ